MQTFKIVLTIFVVLLLQMLLPNYLPFFKYVDLPLVVTVYFGLQRAPMLVMFTGLALGLGADVVNGGVLGVGGFVKTLIGYLVALASVRFALENPLARLAMVRDFVGHGVGRNMHEAPQVQHHGPPGRGPVLRPGMCLAIEPQVNLGSPAVRMLDDGGGHHHVYRVGSHLPRAGGGPPHGD